MQAFQQPRAHLRVAVDVGADLQDRCAAIAARQLRQVRLRHHDRNLDRPPGETLQAEHQPHLSGEGGHVVVVEDDLVHGVLPDDGSRPPA